MAVFHSHVVRCSCGQAQTIRLADGINAQRNKRYREEIVKGTFHRMGCTNCDRLSSVEKSFIYIDPPRGDFFLVKPRQDRHLWKDASAQIEGVTSTVPDEFSAIDRRKLRAVFGLAELREKLIAEDLKLDDRGIELLKLRILHEHPFLMRKPRLRLVLDRVANDRLEFVASYDLDHANFRAGIPKAEAAKLANDANELASWTRNTAAKQPARKAASGDAPSPARAGDHWVSIGRFSTQPQTLDQLKQYAAAVRNGAELDPKDEALVRMLELLPRGDVLAGWAKKDLQVLFEAARKINSGPLQDLIFEVRFGKPLDDEWATNRRPDDIETIWNVMLALPPSNVEGNVAINEIVALTKEEDGDGFYEPQTHDIYIHTRLINNKEDFEDVVRHEIGHAVHEKDKELVDAWLTQEFGWQMFDMTATGVDQWVEAMGGWDQWNIPKTVRKDIVGYLKKAMGPGEQWQSGGLPQVPASHLWWQPDFGPRLAVEQTAEDWYKTHGSWHRVGEKAFFLNYWYQSLCVVNVKTLDLVAKMPSSYAAMSPFEFFAELYALYYDLDDPLRGRIPPKVTAWLAANVGKPFQPRKRTQQPARKASDDVRRPPRTRS